MCNNLILLNELGRRFKEHKHFSCYESNDSHTKKTIISPTVSSNNHKIIPKVNDKYVILK